MRCALASLGSFAAQTGILPSAFRLRVEPPMRVFFIPTNPEQIKNVPLGHFLFVADGEGFEPPEALRLQRFSRPSHSTALPPIRNFARIVYILMPTKSNIFC